MRRTVLFLSTVAYGCSPATNSDRDLSYCGNNEGDAFCASADAATPFCVGVSDPCLEASGITAQHPNGCVAELPSPECREPCGVGNGDGCLDPTVGEATSTGETQDTESTTVGPDPSSSTGDPTTGPAGCTSDAACDDPLQPFCNPDGACVGCDGLADPDAACAGSDAGRPVCSEGECVQCTAERDAACEGSTPICGAANVCEGCTEHSQCPESACHLDGPQAGACFDVADVQMVADANALTTALGEVAADDDVVLMLSGSDYSGVEADLVTNAEVAILGNGSPSISGNRLSGVIATGGDSIVYFAGVSLQSNGSGDGLACSGSSVWLDDVEIRNNAQVGLDVSGGCAAHLRRTVVRANSGGGVVVDGVTSTLALETSAVADNVGASAGPGVRVLSAGLSITYSVLVSNGTFGQPDNLECLSGATGVVRNSIVAGPSGDSIVTCDGLSFTTNALDTSNLGATNVEVGSYDPLWFSATDGVYSLTPAGEAVFVDIAQWVDGDPLADIDGDAIPTDLPSFPGYDQP